MTAPLPPERGVAPWLREELEEASRIVDAWPAWMRADIDREVEKAVRALIGGRDDV